MNARVLGLAAAVTATLLFTGGAEASVPPSIEATSATNVQGVSALLSARANPGGADTAAHFEYVDGARFKANGFDEATTTPQVDLGAGAQSRSTTTAVSGLIPQTAYHYRLIARSSVATITGPEEVFTTTHGFGFLPAAAGFDVTATEHDGSADSRAGSHPYALITTVNFNLAGEVAGQPGTSFTDGDLRDLQLELPPGLIENPSVVAKCTQAQFHTPRSSPFEASRSGESCPQASQIGVVAIHSSFAGGSTRFFGVFNLLPPPGAPSQIGFSPFSMPVALTPHIRGSEGEYGLTLNLSDFPQKLDVYGFKMTIWGAPWNLTHNTERGNCLNESEPADPYAKCSVGRPLPNHPLAYLTLPNTCSPMTFSASANSWQQSPLVETSVSSSGENGRPQPLEGCERLNLAFNELASARPTAEAASTSSGLDFNLELPTEGLTEPESLAPSQVRKAVLTLPEGMTINPSVAAGLGVCTPAQYASETASSAPGAGCPNASKIGDVSVQSPLFEGLVNGSLFLAQPGANPSGSLVALYIVAKSPERGVIVKLPGAVSTDPGSGRLVTTFDNLPQLPYSDFKVHFREGHRAPLISPPTCGLYDTRTDLTPWPDPDAVRHNGSSFKIVTGVGGEPCPSGVLPFAPQTQSGMLNSNAGSYTPFYLHLTRTDAEQEITSYSAKLPPGLLGKIAGIPYCPEADIEAAKQKTGTEETEHPSCPAQSEIGHTQSGYGIGGVLAYAPGGLYLAGPYHGSSFSVVAIDAATVGPFDLGVIVVRSAIKVNPQTAQVSIDSAGSDPIPHILDGIPLHLRDIRVFIDRPNFTLNPTSCDPFSVSSTLTGSGASFSNGSDDSSATVANPFQTLFCSSLPFAPRFGLQLKGGTKRGDFPSLRAVVTPRPGDANIAKAVVTLPPSEFLAQEHIKTVCTHVQLEADACPAGSAYGRAEAVTPLLEEPMRGPVYLGTGYGHALPDLVTVLHGHGIRVVLDGRIDSSHGGLRGSFEVIPDAPVTKFTMVLNGGKRGVLVNEKNICSNPQVATARFVGQNNLGEMLKPKLGVKCGGPKKQRRRPDAKREARR